MPFRDLGDMFNVATLNKVARSPLKGFCRVPIGSIPIDYFMSKGLFLWSLSCVSTCGHVRRRA
jgi:hypothetical protein